VAFLHGAAREKGILNDKLARVTAFNRFYFLLQFGQGCIDQYALKYFASMIGWPIIAVPFLMKTDMPVAEVRIRNFQQCTFSGALLSLRTEPT
jgi:ATP-binding cassette subfamily D (ALD) protein 3